jgi:hypothetical protein
LSPLKITVELDDELVTLDDAAADLLYDELWDVALTMRLPCAVAAAVRMRSLYKLQPIRTIHFTGDEAAAVRHALAQIDACQPTWRDDAGAGEPGRRLTREL